MSSARRSAISSFSACELTIWRPVTGYRWIAHVANLEKLRDGKISTLPITRTPLLDKYTREQLLVELKRRLETPRGARVLAKSKELKEKIAKKVRERNAVAHSFPPPHVVNAYVWNKLAGKDKKVSEERVRELVELVEMCESASSSSPFLRSEFG